MPTNDNQEVVLDSAAAELLISIAVAEGILVWDRKNDDGLGKRYLDRQHPKWLVDQVLEQVVLFDKLFLSSTIPRQFLWGDLLDEGKIGFLDTDGKTDEIPDIPMPRELLESLFEAHGLTDNPLKDPTIWQEAEKAELATLAWEKKYHEKAKGGSEFIGAWMAEKILRHSSHGSHSDNRYDELQQIRKGLDRMRPATNAILSFVRATSLAEERHSALMTPVLHYCEPSPSIDYLENSEANLQTAILKLTTSRLKIPKGLHSLQHALELATEPATIDLRQQIQIWSQDLIDGDEQSVRKIEKDIERAMFALKLGEKVSSLGNLCSYIGVSSMFVPTLLPQLSGMMATIGGTVTVVGSMAPLAVNAINRRKRWATFGSVRE